VADGVHVTGITIGGAITPGGALDPDRIADTYWALHTQPPGEWTAETYVEGPEGPSAARPLGRGRRALLDGSPRP
jgi:hypothetical protein